MAVVLLLRGRRIGCGLDREVPGRLTPHEPGEQRWSVHPRGTHPDEPGAGGHQRHHPAVCEQSVPLDRHRAGPGQPRLPQAGQPREPAGHVGRIGYPVGGCGLTRPHLDRDVRPVQPDKRILVGHVIAEVDDGRGPDPVPQRIDGLPFGSVDHRQLEHFLARLDPHVGPGRRAAEQFLDRRVGHGVGDVPIVECDRGRLGFDPKSRVAGGDPVHLVEQLLPEFHLLPSERADKILIELAAVRADEHHLAVESREGGEVGERPPRDHGRVGRAERGDGPQGHDRLAHRNSLRGVVHDRGERAVVVRRHEQHRHLRDRLQGPVEIVEGRLAVAGGRGVCACHRASPAARAAELPWAGPASAAMNSSAQS